MIPDQTTVPAAEPLPAKAAKPKRAPSRYDDNPKSGPVHVQRFAESGVEYARVPLFGRGYGKFMILDAADWDAIVALGLPRCWILSGTGPGYVTSARREVHHLAMQRAACPLTALARFLMQAEPGDRVHYLDRDPLNLRRANLWLEKRPHRAKAPETTRH